MELDNILLLKEGYSLSLATILRCCLSLGLTLRDSTCFQLIHKVNKVKRLEWCQANIDDEFEDVIFTDKITGFWSTVDVEKCQEYIGHLRNHSKSH